MNFTDLYKKIVSIDKGITESEIVECPMDHPMEQPKQQDSVNMNVSINGQGADGIRDLMDILRNIDHDEKHDILIGEPEEDEQDSDEIEFDMEPSQDNELEPLMTDEYENSAIGGSDAEVYGISAVTAMGDDMFSKGKEAPKQAGGGNPWNMKESLITNLHNLYQEIKQR